MPVTAIILCVALVALVAWGAYREIRDKWAPNVDDDGYPTYAVELVPVEDTMKVFDWEADERDARELRAANRQIRIDRHMRRYMRSVKANHKFMRQGGYNGARARANGPT